MSEPHVVRAIEALKRGDRETAVSLIREDMAQTKRGGNRWRSIATVMRQVGEIELALEAARRFAKTDPPALENHLFYWSMAAELGREDDVRAEVEATPAWKNTAPVLHLMGTLAAGEGDNERATQLFRQAIAAAPRHMSWFPLAMAKRFSDDDPDLAAMREHEPLLAAAPPDTRARHAYAMGKALLDLGDVDAAMEHFNDGATIRGEAERFDPAAYERFADETIATMDADFFAQLKPSEHRGSQALFVNGLPRSGTTLMEQMLAAHSQVADGGEINLFASALLPLGGRSSQAASRYDASADDPWGKIARTYERLVRERFRTDAHIVDKTLMQSGQMGLLLHALPGARVLWLRRDPEDSAWSTYRNYFTHSLPWSWSFENIGHVYRIEEKLHRHWISIFPDRILTVRYEEFVASPDDGAARILDFFGLEREDVIAGLKGLKRQVRTASVSQVRESIDRSRIGQADRIDRWLEPFRKAYRGEA